MLDERGTKWVIAMLEEIEREIAGLYGAFADRLPEMAAFWTHLQQDEQRHAGWVADLTPMAETGQLQAEERHASPEVYQGFSEYLYDETHRARKHPLTTARFVERSYLEKHLMEIFATDTGELRRLMQTLITDTERHAQVIETALKELEKTTG